MVEHEPHSPAWEPTPERVCEGDGSRAISIGEGHIERSREVSRGQVHAFDDHARGRSDHLRDRDASERQGRATEQRPGD